MKLASVQTRNVKSCVVNNCFVIKQFFLSTTPKIATEVKTFVLLNLFHQFFDFIDFLPFVISFVPQCNIKILGLFCTSGFQSIISVVIALA